MMKKENKRTDPAFVGVGEEFVPETNPESASDKTKGSEKKGLIAGIGVWYGLVIFFCLIALSLFVVMAFNMIDRIADQHQTLTSSAESYNEFEQKSFNNQFESVDGEQTAAKAKVMLTRIAEHNRAAQEKNLIKVTFLSEAATADSASISSFAERLEDDKVYLLTLDYGENGLVSAVFIKEFKN